MRTAAKRDANEANIIAAYELVGAMVEQCSQEGWPDLLVYYNWTTYLVEVKSESGKLTKAQEKWFKKWRAGGGTIYVVRNEVEALNVIGVVIVERKEDGTYTCGQD